jgi:hypothetical protein
MFPMSLQSTHPQGGNVALPQHREDGYLNSMVSVRQANFHDNEPALATPTKPTPKQLPWRMTAK